MTTLLHSDSRCLYSWWWDSHISPKNSKWLQENLQDMDAKVKAMIKLIEEDADSFARRAEMYYQKRPELMKLVEEFYRAYRALAERYDHATVELRHAHRTMAEAFPNQVQFVLPDGSSSQECGPHKPEIDSDDFDRASSLIEKNGPFPGESDTVIGKKGLKQPHEIFGGGLEKEEQGKTSNAEIQKLKKELDDTHSEKESVLLQYQKSVEKLSNLEEELNRAQTTSRALGEEANKAAVEVQTLKEALVKLESERDAGCLKHKEFLERISDLEFMASQAQKDAQGCNERAVIAETEAKCLEKELSRSGTAKDAGLLQYKQCLEKISDLERNLSLALEEARLLYDRAEKSETEVRELKKALSAMNEEKKDAANRYEDCLDKISKLEAEISSFQEEIRRLNNVVLMETSNQSLRLEADNLTKKIAMKDEELSRKHEVLEKLQACVNTDQLRFVQVEATLQTLQYLHSQSQEEEKALALELKNGLQMLKDIEISKHALEEENRVLGELNSSSAVSMGNFQGEILRLREMKEKLEEELQLQMGHTSSLQEEIYHLKEDIRLLNKRHADLLKQVELVGLNPECIVSSVKDLQIENSKLRQIREDDREEKEALFKKFDDMKKLLDKNSVLECSVTREKVKALQESLQLLNGEKSALVAEKAALLSHLQIIMENMQKLVEQNTLLENSLSVTNVELEGLREKSKGLEELCNFLNNDKSNLLNERGTLVVQLKNVEGRLENLEWRMAEMERKNVGLEKEKESIVSHVEELKVSLGVEQQERASFALSSGARLTCLENHVQLIHEETRRRRKEFEEADKTVNAQFEIFILQNFIEDMKQKNYSLKIECQKHMEASKFAETLISELEIENLEQQVEAELLLDEIENARMGICKMFEALGVGLDVLSDRKIASEKIFLNHAIDNIADLKRSILDHEDNNLQLLVENSVLLTLVGQLRLQSVEIASEKKTLDQELEIMTAHLVMAENEKHKLLEMNRQLKLDYSQVSQENLENLEKHIVELSEEKLGLNKEIECLREANGHLESELGISCEEIKEHRIREENLSSELLEISNEFEIWESQATTFYFDLQISSVHEVLFGNKVHELTKVCETLENESVSKTAQIEKMIERIGFMEIEIEELRTQLLAYAPAIESLRDNVASLEDNILSPPELDVAENLEPKDANLAVHLHDEIHQELIEDNKSVTLKGIPELQKLQTRIKAFEKVLVEKMKGLTAQKVIEESSSDQSFGSEMELNSKLKFLKIRPEISEVTNRILMKDIPLDRVSNASLYGMGRRSDQMLELWEAVEPKTHKKKSVGHRLSKRHSSSELDAEKELGVDKLAVPGNFNEPNQVRNKREILDLNALQVTVEELSRKLERNKKKNSKSVDLGTVKEQLQEVEETIARLADVNNQLSRKIEVGPLQSDGNAFSPEMGNFQRKRVSEQARKGSEKLQRLQLEVQKIQYVLLKLQDEKKSKGKLRFARSRTGVILKNFIYNAGRRSPRRKKGRLCGCFRPSSHGDGSSSINVFN